MARYPDCNFIYVSYSQELAAFHTHTVRKIMTLPEYQELFDARISNETKAKDNFETTQGGSVYAAGIGGTITGRGAGIQGATRFGGCAIIDDSIKPADATSEKIRATTNDWYLNTLFSRRNDPATPFFYIAQVTHEDDLSRHLRDHYDGRPWEFRVLDALDAAGNALCPHKHTVEQLLLMKEKMPYVFAAQMQQNAIPAGGALYKPEWFVRLDQDPEMLATFITADTAETEKSYNDATVFSFWGIYNISEDGMNTESIGLHWIDCWELWVEPKDLEQEFTNFYYACLRYPKQPQIAAIEKKSTGVTLVSVIKDKLRGLQIRETERNRSSGNKTERFLDAQPALASRLVSITRNAKHHDLVLNHMSKITANQSHRYDDIADTFADAVKLAFIDKVIPYMTKTKARTDKIITTIASNYQRDSNARKRLYGTGNTRLKVPTHSLRAYR
jgi:hypothetical protein